MLECLFCAEYKDMNADYSGKGIDQLAECIKKIKTNPNDRRIVLSAWNPSDLPIMALPPCHMFCQFYVANGELSWCALLPSTDFPFFSDRPFLDRLPCALGLLIMAV